MLKGAFCRVLLGALNLTFDTVVTQLIEEWSYTMYTGGLQNWIRAKKIQGSL